MSHWLIGEAVPALADKQLAYVGVAFIAFLIVFFLPIRRMSWLIPFIYWGNIALLFAVELFGHSRLGAQRWIDIPFINATIQPSEFVKPALILMLAYLIHKNPPPLHGYRLKDFLRISFYILLPFVLIAKEPDLGTALVLLIAGYGVLFIVGINWRIWATIFVVLGLSAPLLYTQLKPYQKKRITDFVGKPSYHVNQALIAIGSGGMEGQEKEEATQTQLKFLPVSSTDFIFAYLGERFGFKGMMVVIGLYILLIFNLLYISAKFASDYLVKAFASGLAFLLFVYMGVNIYMVIGMAPVVGLPLPMFSHGGTSFIIFAVIFGILQNLITFKDYSRYTSDSKISMISKNKKIRI